MAVAVRPDIPRAKRAGLDLDLDAVCGAGPAELETDDHYRLKTYGVCSQRHDDLFMVRMRVPGGVLEPGQVAAVSEAARRFGGGWLHLTTRQNVELHSVQLHDVPALRDLLAPVGLFGRSACGHTVRNVMACAEAATSIDEPFDCGPDAARLSQLLVARSTELNVVLPSRLNIVLGGCADCSLDALTNDIGLVARVRDGVPGYQLWVGGSLGNAPRLSFMLRPFITRAEVWPAVWTIIEWFCNEGDVDQVAKGRLKFIIEARGENALRAAFAKRFPHLAAQEQPAIEAIEVPTEAALDRVLAKAPPLGWRDGVRPERRTGRATVTVRVPLGDLLAEDLDCLAAGSPDGRVALTREQNVALRSIPVPEVPAVLGLLAERGLGPDGARGAADVRACPGLSFCSLAITGSQSAALAIERALVGRPDLPRDVSIAVSGCPNACTKHQAADVGFAGGKVKVGARIGLGYQMYLGADLAAGQVGEPVVRVLEDEIGPAVVAVVETWMALRRPGELPGRTFRRAGLALVASSVALRLRGDGDELGSVAA